MRVSATTESSSRLSSSPRPVARAAARRTPKVGNVRRRRIVSRADGRTVAAGIEHPRSRLALARVSQVTMGMREE